jgi:class 3 adenylate cyclase
MYKSPHIGDVIGSFMASTSADMTILVADICDSVRLFESLGNDEAHRLAARSLQVMSSIVATNEGRVCRTLGDGVLCTFPCPDRAFSAASAIHDAHRTGSLSIKIGITHGPLIEDSGELFGDAVNLAARITSLARGRETLLSEDAIHGMSDVHRSATEMLIATLVKGKRQPVKVYRAIQQDDVQATTQLRPQSQVHHVQSLTLVITRTDQTEILVTSESERVVIGRTPGCDIVVDSSVASRQHAIIEPRGNQYVLTDTSTNGTFLLVNDREVLTLKRESTGLPGKGVISFGAKPCQQPNHVIHFRIEQISQPSALRQD